MGGKPSSHKDSDPTVGRKTQEENLVKNPPAGSHDGCTAQNQSGIPVNSATTTTRAKDTTKPSVIPHIASPQTSIQVSRTLPANKFPHPRSQVAAGVEVRSKFESPEYNTFVKHFDQMVEGITDPVALSFELYSHKLISQETQSELQDHEMSIPDKNHVLLSTVGQRIILNPAVAFATFLAALESMPFCKDLAANLDETFGMFIGVMWSN